MAGFESLALMPVKIVVVLLVLPFAAVEYIFDGLWLLATIGALLRCDDRVLALKSLSTSFSTDSLLKDKLPNSIAVRS